MLRTCVIIVALLAVAGGAGAQTTEVRGVVYADVNGNGIRDKGEAGLAGVAVSNQEFIVVTDAAGAFHIAAGRSGVVFVSVPDGYRSVGRFWRSAGESSIAFALAPTPRVRDFTFVHTSDTHIAPAVAARTRRMLALVDSLAPSFLIITGDLVRDALRVSEKEATGYYDLFVRETSPFRTPLWTVPGNHENFGIERDTSHVSAANPLYGRAMYHHYFGPDYYSFTQGGVHFVGLNTVDIDDQSYYGHVDSTQLAWLARDLALVPKDMPVVTFDHIPFFSTWEGLGGYRGDPPAPSLITVNGKTAYRHTVSNAFDVLSVLRTRRHVLALGGHIHAVEHITYEMDGQRTRFNQTAAIVAPTTAGGFHFPSGITLYRVHDGTIDDGRFIPLGIPDVYR
jgi:hypothetical protein